MEDEHEDSRSSMPSINLRQRKLTINETSTFLYIEKMNDSSRKFLLEPYTYNKDYLISITIDVDKK